MSKIGFNLSPYQWKAFPYDWLDDTERGLKTFTWKNGAGSSNAAALMIYYVFCLFSPPKDDPTTGIKHGEVMITYDELRTVTGLSRLLISNGIKILIEKKLIELSNTRGRKNIYLIKNLSVSKGKWVKSPFRFFIKGRRIKNIFSEFSLRNKSSLHAIKIYMLILKHSNKGKSRISYDKIVEHLSICKADIRKALSLLQHQNLIYVFKKVPNFEEQNFSNVYFIRGINSEKDMSDYNLIENDFGELEKYIADIDVTDL